MTASSEVVTLEELEKQRSYYTVTNPVTWRSRFQLVAPEPVGTRRQIPPAVRDLPL